MGRFDDDPVPQDGETFYIMATVDMADGTMSSVHECFQYRVPSLNEAHKRIIQEPGCYDEDNKPIPERWVVFEVKAVRKYTLVGEDIKTVKELKRTP